MGVHLERKKYLLVFCFQIKPTKSWCQLLTQQKLLMHKTRRQSHRRWSQVITYAYVRLNMFWAPLFPSSEAHNDSIGYHIGHLVLELLLVGGLVQAGWMSVWTKGCNCLWSGHSSILPALNFIPAATPEPDGLCVNQRYRRELLMMRIMVPETCWA